MVYKTFPAIGSVRKDSDPSTFFYNRKIINMLIISKLYFDERVFDLQFPV